jgi:integrase
LEVEHLLRLFEADWLLSQKASLTVKTYLSYLNVLLKEHPEPTSRVTKEWISSSSSIPVRRKRAQAVRAFGKWAELNGVEVFQWWRTIPVAKEPVTPQETVTPEIFSDSLAKVKTLRDKALIEILWSTGLRRSEVARLEVSDVNFTDGFVVVRTSKSGKPRIAPLSPSARRSLVRFLGRRTSGLVFGLKSSSIRIRLARLGVPPAHAWRRGWAVHALRNGISETSVRSVAGWSSGAMVARYTKALSGELAISEFGRLWQDRT